MQTPVTFLIFNRPSTTARVFEEIRRARPPKLMVVADGPRPDRPGEAEQVVAARAIVDQVDWPCEVLKNYSDTNLGCKRRISSGLDWVFSCVEESIILEDDCLPQISFFDYCQQLLERYREDTRIMMISGRNHLLNYDIPESYFFSKHFSVWGWASWRRAWNHNKVAPVNWNYFKSRFPKYTFYSDKILNKYYYRIFDSVMKGDIDTWDYQWLLSCLLNSGLSIVPKVNLIKNIGFSGTHTGRQNRNDPNLDNPTFPLDTDLLIHPFWVMPDDLYDSFVNHRIIGNSFKYSIKEMITSLRNYFIPLTT